jgi:bis(5'-nucleosidyl)-tetraphosphatase
MSFESKRPTLTAGIVIVRASVDDYRYLLLRVYGYWDFPKGIVEPGEAPIETAQREVREETGLTDLEFRWGERYVETAPYRNKIARYYLAQSQIAAVTFRINSALGRPEHHEYRWCSYEAARPLLVPRVLSVLDWAHDQVTRS